MPTRMTKKTFTNTSADVLNAIRNYATTNYKDYVPYAQPNAESIRAVGAIIMDSPQLQNEFVQALINRIGMVLIENKMLENQWAVFKKGVMEYGEAIESVFVDIAKVFDYDAGVAENEVYKRQIPDIKSQFFIINYQKFYKQTIQEDTLRKAFLSERGLFDLTDKIVLALINGEANDEFLVMKYMLARNILNGKLKVVEIPAVSSANAKSIVSVIKGVSNKFTFPNREFNQAGVMNQSKKDEQYLICDSVFDSTIDVEVLASAFNMDKAEFSGRRMLVDGFGSLDQERLAMIFDGDSSYVPLSAEELEALSAIPAILVDKDYFVLIDNMRRMTTKYNEQGLYWNYWLHTWKTFGTSAFSQAVVFVPSTSSVLSVTVNPSQVSSGANTSFVLTADVETEGFASKAVEWSTNNEGVTVSSGGIVTVGNLADGTVVTITATSVEDGTKSGTCTLTVGSGGTPATDSVISVTVVPATLSVAPNSTTNIGAVVEVTGNAPQTVTWSSNNADVSVASGGIVTVGDVASNTEVVLTATSTFDTTKSGTCTVTVVGGGGGTFNPVFSPASIDASFNTVDETLTVSGNSVLTKPSGANYYVNVVGFDFIGTSEPNASIVRDIPGGGDILAVHGLVYVPDDEELGITGGNKECLACSIGESSTQIVFKAKLPSNSNMRYHFTEAMGYYGVETESNVYTATGIFKVVVADLDNDVSAIKSITVNITYTEVA